MTKWHRKITQVKTKGKKIRVTGLDVKGKRIKETFTLKVLAPILVGYAVRFSGGFHKVEYWQYDPAMLTKRQLKQLNIQGWKKFSIAVKDTDRG